MILDLKAQAEPLSHARDVRYEGRPQRLQHTEQSSVSSQARAQNTFNEKSICLLNAQDPRTA